ncbi:hypothetical protein GmHk_17G049255 [Glycine max]|nr:hypothetical protein GmHk_17G049255 [Glycine max]
MQHPRVLQEMAPKKLSMKRSRRDATGEGSSVAPEFDSHRFRSAEHQQCFEAIKGWSLHRERCVQLREDEYTDFQEEIARRQEGVRDMHSWVKGQWIPFDADALSQFLSELLFLEEGQQCEFSQRRNRAGGFDEEAIAQLLCTPEQDFAWTAAVRRVRIMRTSMTTFTQTWMTLLISNVLPSDHNSDLPLPKCQLVYAILTRMSVHVDQVIANAIYLYAGMMPTRDPLDPDKSNRALGFPALFTGLCQSFGVPVTPSKAANHRGQVQIHECLYRFSLSQQGQGSAPFACPTPEQFGAEVAWPRDWPDVQAGEEPARSSGEPDASHMDEDMTDLLGFLGGSGAT